MIHSYRLSCPLPHALPIPVPAVEFMLDAEQVHRAALALRDAGLAPRQLGHDDLGIDAIGEHVAVIAVAGDHAVLVAVERRLQAHRDRLLPDIEVTEPADQAEAIELARSEERRVGKECVSTCRSRWWPYH